MILDKNEDPELIYENIWRMHKKKIHRICKPVKKSEEEKSRYGFNQESMAILFIQYLPCLYIHLGDTWFVPVKVCSYWYL